MLTRWFWCLCVLLALAAVEGCHEHCVHCVASTCKKCHHNMYLYDGSCVQTCPLGFISKRPGWIFNFGHEIGRECIAEPVERGFIVAWGSSETGGTFTERREEDLNDVMEVVSTLRAFAARKRDGTILAWGDEKYGGKSIGSGHECCIAQSGPDCSQPKTSGRRRLACSDHQQQDACQTSSEACFWEFNSQVCQQQQQQSGTGGTQCGGKDQVQCTNDAGCEWRDNDCHPLNQQSGTGDTQCGGKDQVQCTNDVGCEWRDNDCHPLNQQSGTGDPSSQQSGTGDPSSQQSGTETLSDQPSEMGSTCEGKDQVQCANDVVCEWGETSCHTVNRCQNSTQCGQCETKTYDKDTLNSINWVGSRNTLSSSATIFSAGRAFAVLKSDGTVDTWGQVAGGGIRKSGKTDSKADLDAWVDATLIPVAGVETIFSTMRAFAALRKDKSVVCWGHTNYGGNCTSLGLSNVQTIFSISGETGGDGDGGAFAVLKEDGTVESWGSSSYGGDIDVCSNSNIKSLPEDLKDPSKAKVVTIFTAGGYPETGSCVDAGGGAFAALRVDGSVSVWGHTKLTKNSDDLAAVSTIFGGAKAFAAVLESTKVKVWPDQFKSIQDTIDRVENVATIVSNVYENNDAFVALSTDGIAIPWGIPENGGDGKSEGEAANLTNLLTVFASHQAFAGLKQDGSLVAWGNVLHGGSLCETCDLAKVEQLVASGVAFAAVGVDDDDATNGKVVSAWGWEEKGGQAPASVYRNTPNVQRILASNLHAFVAQKSCDNETYADSESLICLRCDAGKSTGGQKNNFGANKCQDCPAGKKRGDIEVGCSDCSRGKYSSVTASKACVDAPPGYFLNECSSVPLLKGCKSSVECPQGYFCVDGNKNSCVPGSVASVSGSIRCEDCARGEHAPGYRQTNCSSCKAGFYSADKGAAVCTKCENGTSSKIGDSRCTPCNPGEYLKNIVSTGSSTCEPCPPGFKCPIKSTRPLECKPGEYAPANSPDCLPCGLGEFSRRSGATQCLQCPKGTYQDGKGKDACIPCPTNTFSETKGNSARAECKVCSFEYNPNTITLTEGSLTNASCVCAPGYFHNPAMLMSDKSHCLPCPVGAECAEPSTRVETLKTQRGFWRFDEFSLVFYECLVAAHCVGTVNVSIANGSRDRQCSSGHTGVLCASCADGFKRFGKKCIQCGAKSSTVSIVVVVVTVLALVLLTVYFLRSARNAAVALRDGSDSSANEAGSHEQAMSSAVDGVAMSVLTSVNTSGTFEQSKEPASTGSAAGSAAGTIKVLISYLQVFSSLNMTMGVPWPVDFKTMIDSCQFVNIDVFSLLASFNVCAFVTSFFTNFMVHMMVVPWFIVLSYIASSIATMINRKGYHIYAQCRTKVAFGVMFLLYPSVGSKIFQVFKCLPLGTRSFLEADMNIECHVGDHVLYVTVAIAFFCVYILGIPIVIFYKLKTNLPHLHDPKSSKYHEVRDELGDLYVHYEKPFWYWELIEMVRKVFLTGVIIVIGSGKSVQILIAMLVQFSYLLGLVRFSPYNFDRDDAVQFVASIQLFLTLVCGLVIKLRAYSVKDYLGEGMDESIAYGNILVALNVSVWLIGIGSVFLSTSKGQMLFDRYCGGRGKTPGYGGGSMNVKVQPRAPCDHSDKMAALQMVRETFGANSVEYKSLIQSMQSAQPPVPTPTSASKMSEINSKK